jgi:pimeloyl-ACP methyl ester carboxylesterase
MEPSPRRRFHDWMNAIATGRYRALSPLGVAAVTALTLGTMAWYVGVRVREAEARKPARGRFMEVDGVLLHYDVRGEGPPVVLLHGNGTMIDELEASGVVGLLARHYRVIMFDRPGFGESERPAERSWTPREQATLFAAALEQLGVGRATIVGHSWGTLVALALALDHPARVRGLVLASGFYYPAKRLTLKLASAPSWPVIGPLMRHTTSPLIGRLTWGPLARFTFGPAPVPKRFARLSPWRFLKPSRLRANAIESGMLAREAEALSRRYSDVAVPTVILAGEQDRIVGPGYHSERLHRAIPGSVLQTIPWVGHMLHHAVPHRILRAVDDVALRDATGAGPSAPGASTRPLRDLMREIPHGEGRAAG